MRAVETELHRGEQGFDMASLFEPLQTEQSLGLGLVEGLLGEAGQRCDFAPAVFPFQQQPLAHRDLAIVELQRLAERQSIAVEAGFHHGFRLNLEKSGRRFSLKALRPS